MLLGMNITLLAMVGLVGFAIAALLYGLSYVQISNGKQADMRVAKVSSMAVRGKEKAESQQFTSRRKNVQDTLKDIEVKQKHKASQSTNPPLSLRLQQAGLVNVTVSRFFIFSAILAALCGVAGLVVHAPPLLLLGIVFVMGLGFPRYVVNFLRKRRQAAFVEELANAVEVIVRGVKAGLPLNDCLRMIAAEANEPVKSEFRAVVDALQIGIPIDEAVDKIYELMPLAEANFFAIVIAIQSKAGGNLSEALGNLAKVLRERKKMRGKIQAMSMEAKSSASIIGALPIIVMGLVYLTSPDYIMVLFTTPAGQVVLGVSALVMMTGIFVMKRMINFDF